VCAGVLLYNRCVVWLCACCGLRRQQLVSVVLKTMCCCCHGGGNAPFCTAPRDVLDHVLMFWTTQHIVHALWQRRWQLTSSGGRCGAAGMAW
jgi:hypothetical protein